MSENIVQDFRGVRKTLTISPLKKVIKKQNIFHKLKICINKWQYNFCAIYHKIKNHLFLVWFFHLNGKRI